MSPAQTALRTCGISPKVAGSAIAGLIVFALTKLAVSVDPILEQAINVLAMIVVAYVMPAGAVVMDSVDASDDALAPDVAARLRQEDGYGLVEVAFAFLLVIVALVLLTGRL